ncbi:GNAT family N-acetyltransferase [Empedobacter brevis]|uniref:GNAT family N-acetyltransferase n=1 Tax=Empedobacter brevis TaxID=247 RepID=UPI00289FED6B|nr:GNAT family N-acetyltransferase [Empedobacter brevis]
MITILILIFQYYFLGKLFNKDKLQLILKVIGLYFLGVFVIAINIALLMSFGVIKSTLPELMESKWMMVPDLVLFVLLSFVYYNYLKRKWTMEMFSADLEKRKEELLENIAVNQKINPVKLDVYCHFHTVNEKNIHLVQPLAKEIWDECYKDLLSQDQIDYMIDMMYNNDKVNEGISNGEIWEILKIDNVPSGYLHYKLDENNTVFLSKIYLKESNQTKGIGQLMLNRVIDFAKEKEAKAVHLTVNKHNAKAIRFYEKNGFKNIESKTFDIGNGYIMDDYIYQKSV